VRYNGRSFSAGDALLDAGDALLEALLGYEPNRVSSASCQRQNQLDVVVSEK
jgi:hypothetical protein